MHQDVKPSNILIGNEPGSIFLADFGLAACWGHEHSPPEFEFQGSPKWASFRAHEGESLVPSDDLQSLGYSLAYFVLGELPWRAQAMIAFSEEDHWDLRQVKTKFIRGAYKHDLPEQLVAYLQYCRIMRQDPNYDYLKALWSLIGFEGEEFDWAFEWDGIDFDDSSVTSEWVTSEWYAEELDSVDSNQH